MRIALFYALLLLSLSAFGKVEAPNYNFGLKTLEKFYPGRSIADLKADYGEGELLRQQGAMEMRRFMVKQLEFKFPVIIQTEEGKIQDMHAQLPSFFLHNIFHQSLIDQIGKQQKYLRVEEEAVYVWEKEDFKYTYSAACTITCFPIFLNVTWSKARRPASLKPIIEEMSRIN